jgi:hypothetical protein
MTSRFRNRRMGMVDHTSKPSYSGGDRRIMVQGQPRKKLVRPHLNKQTEHSGALLALWEAKRGGFTCKGRPRQKAEDPI